MKTTDTPLDLFFDQLRDMLGMETLLREALPRLASLCSMPRLRAIILDYHSGMEIRSVEISAIFTRFRVSSDGEPCEAVTGLIEGGESHLLKVGTPATRDLMIVAHTLRIIHYGIAACEITCRLAERLTLLREARTLGMILTRDTENAATLLALEPEIFHLARQQEA